MNIDRKAEMERAILAAVCIALGIVLIMHPGFTGIVICRAAGLFAVISGGVRTAAALRERDAGWVVRLSTVFRALLTAFGIFALARPQEVLSFLPMVLGVYLLMESLGKFQRAVVLKQAGYVRWWTALIMGILAAALGVLLVVNPFRAAESMLVFLGVSLVIDGAADLWILWCFASQR